MNIKSVHIENFRCIERLDVELGARHGGHPPAGHREEHERQCRREERHEAGEAAHLIPVEDARIHVPHGQENGRGGEDVPGVAPEKQHEAGQYSAVVVADVPPDASGPLVDRLRQLGKVAALSGAIPSLRTPSTLEALNAAAKAGLVEPGDAEELAAGWTMATRARGAATLVRGKPIIALPSGDP